MGDKPGVREASRAHRGAPRPRRGSCQGTGGQRPAEAIRTRTCLPPARTVSGSHAEGPGDAALGCGAPPARRSGAATATEPAPRRRSAEQGSPRPRPISIQGSTCANAAKPLFFSHTKRRPGCQPRLPPLPRRPPSSPGSARAPRSPQASLPGPAQRPRSLGPGPGAAGPAVWGGRGRGTPRGAPGRERRRREGPPGGTEGDRGAGGWR